MTEHHRGVLASRGSRQFTSPTTSDDEIPWQAFGLCAQVDPELFFPEPGDSATAAKEICGRCDVQAECLDWALERGERFGVWGGTTELDRRELRKATRPAPAASTSRSERPAAGSPAGSDAA